MRVTLDEIGGVRFDGALVGYVEDVELSIEHYELVQKYLDVANEAFDALSSYNLTFEGDQDLDFPSGVFYHLFSDILQKVGD